jgi:glycopeptide antibiotics resistance protein
MAGGVDVDRLGRRLALGWTLAYVALIVVVSLWPSSYRPEPEHLARQWALFGRTVTIDPHVVRHMHSLRDLATNFLLYVPLGVLLPWAIGPRPLLLVLGGLVGPALSTAMETAQVWTSRGPSFWDIMMNAGGHLFAYGVVALVMTRRHLSAAVFLGRKGSTPRATLASGLRLMYMPLLWFISLLPLDVSVKGEILWSKLRGIHPDAGTVWLDPTAPWSVGRAIGLAVGALLLVPFGFLTYLTAPERGARRYLAAAFGGLGVGAAIEGSQLLVVSRSTDVLQVVSAGAGAMLGVAFARVWDRSAAADEATPRHQLAWTDGLLAAIVVYVLFLLVEAWRPFVFVPTSGEALSRLVHAELVPLRSYVTTTRSLAIFRDAGREAAFYLPLGMLLQAFLSKVELPAWMPRRFWVALAVAVGVGGFLEAGQCMFPDRLVDVTDVLSHAIGATVGYLLLSALRRDSESRH